MRAWQRRAAAALAAVLALSLAGCAGDDEPTAAGGLVFVSTRDGDYAIYSMDADGGGEQRLTESEAEPSSPQGLFFQIEPALSPDGETIAFASRRAGTFDIYAMAADGTGTRRLTSTPEDDGHPTWSPDGSLIAFERGVPGDLYVMNADGSGARRIGDDEAPELQPAWSPDGRWIAYSRREPGTTRRELWLVRPDGTGARPVTSLLAVSYSPSWSPQADRLAFSTDLEGSQYEIYTVGIDGKELRKVTTTPEDSFEPSWSADGTTIAFSEGGSIRTIQLRDGEAEGGGAEELTDPAGNDSSPAWEPVPASEG